MSLCCWAAVCAEDSSSTWTGGGFFTLNENSQAAWMSVGKEGFIKVKVAGNVSFLAGG